MFMSWSAECRIENAGISGASPGRSSPDPPGGTGHHGGESRGSPFSGRTEPSSHTRPVHRWSAAPRQSERPPIVWIPGLGAVRTLLPSFTRCADRATCHLLDLPGVATLAGQLSPRPRLGPLANTVADWLGSVPDGPVVLVGHSTGAQVALRAANQNPSRVRALVLLGMTFPPCLRQARSMPRAVVRTALREPVGMLYAVSQDYLRVGPRRLLPFLRSAWDDRPEDTLARTDCPVLLVAGQWDRLAPPGWIRWAAGRAPRGSAVTVPGSHGFPYNEPEPTAALVLGAARP